MDVLAMVLGSGAVLVAAYFTFGTWLSRRIFRLDDANTTPAVEINDGNDYVPTKKSIIFGHHFTSIAGTGPIVGPAIAVMWGWLPALLWVVFGSIFVGAVHDLGAIVVSLRKKGRSIGDIAGDLLGPRARVIFLGILVVGLWLVLAVFGLVIASVLRQYPSAVFPVLVQTPLAMVVGWVIYRRGVGIAIPSMVVLALMYASVIWGDVAGVHVFNAWMSALPIWVWVVGLLVYSYIASVLPVWLLLQPRDYINALQLVSALVLLVVGLGAAAVRYGGSEVAQLSELREDGAESEQTQLGELRYPEADQEQKGYSPRLSLVAPMVDWNPAGAPPIVPILFITVACGAVSGFHCLVGSGTTSKQIAKERDAKAVGYGSMVTEGFLAVIVIAACAGGIGLGTKADLFQSVGSQQGDGMRLLGLVEIGVRNDSSNQVETWTVFALQHDPHAFMTSTPPYFKVSEDPRLEGLTTIQSSREDLSWGGSSSYVGDTQEAVAEFHYKRNDAQFSIEPSNVGVENWSAIDGGAIRQSVDGRSIELLGDVAFNTRYRSWQSSSGLASTVGAFVEGGANFLTALNIPRNIAIALMAVMVASFAATTMDTSCRLQRYVVEELARVVLVGRRGRRPGAGGCPSCGYDLAGIDPERAITHDDSGKHPHDAAALTRCPECGAKSTADQRESEGVAKRAIARASWWNPFKWLTTAQGATIFAVVSAGALAAIPPAGQPWSLANAGMGAMTLWPLFGCVNQLLAGFAFVVIIAWLRMTGRPWWFAVIPALIMLVMPAWALVWQMAIGNAENPSWITGGKWLLVVTGCIALALEVWLVTEAAVRWPKAKMLVRG